MPPAEIKYNNCPNGGALVLGYKNKWIEDSLEYQNTQRSFDFSEKDKGLLKKIEKISLDCWKKFNLRGYARVDIRIDKKNNPYIIEINANPCLSPNSGFYAACDKGGFKFEEVISDIIYDGKNSFLF